jgi:hypothetical protein
MRSEAIHFSESCWFSDAGMGGFGIGVETLTQVLEKR